MIDERGRKLYTYIVYDLYIVCMYYVSRPRECRGSYAESRRSVRVTSGTSGAEFIQHRISIHFSSAQYQASQPRLKARTPLQRCSPSGHSTPSSAPRGSRPTLICRFMRNDPE